MARSRRTSRAHAAKSLSTLAVCCCSRTRALPSRVHALEYAFVVITAGMLGVSIVYARCTPPGLALACVGDWHCTVIPRRRMGCRRSGLLQMRGFRAGLLSVAVDRVCSFILRSPAYLTLSCVGVSSAMTGGSGTALCPLSARDTPPSCLPCYSGACAVFDRCCRAACCATGSSRRCASPVPVLHLSSLLSTSRRGEPRA